MRVIATSSTYRRDFKRSVKRAKDLKKLEAVIKSLMANQSLAPRHRVHKLSGDYDGLTENYSKKQLLFCEYK